MINVVILEVLCNTPSGCITCLVNPVNLVKLVKGFSRALGNYGWLSLKELYGSQSLNFNSLFEAEIGPARTAQ